MENPFVAKARLQTLRRYLPVSQNFLEGEAKEYIPAHYFFESVPVYRPIQRLSDNFAESLRMMADLQKLRAELPGIDCGACGAPNCRAFAEDVVRGNAQRNGCVVERKRQLEDQLNQKETEQHHDSQ